MSSESVEWSAIPEAPTESRAVLRVIEPGLTANCGGCDELVKFTGGRRANRVIANVYEQGVWDRVEHYHPACYEQAGEPHGAVQSDPVPARRRAIGATAVQG